MKQPKKWMTAEFKGIILILSAAMLWGTTGTSQAFAPMGSTPMTIGALRLAVGGIFLFIMAIVRDRHFYRNMPVNYPPTPLVIGGLVTSVASPVD